jgi:acyl-CoA synthetase (NDP forming)
MFQTLAGKPLNNLKPFFSPQSVAIIGASDDLNKFGGRVLNRLIEFGFGGRIYPVNPKREKILNLQAYPKLNSLPEVPDHVCIALPAKSVLDAVDECAKFGVRFCTIFTSGFAETGTEEGKKLQNKIKLIAEQSGMRIMGPNCNGLISFINNFAISTTGALTGENCIPGNVGIVAQSGGLGQVGLMYRAIELGMGISHQVSCGNQADLGVLDFVEFMVDDPATQVILMIVEDMGDGQKLRKVAEKAANKEKPIVILKLGRSEAGRLAASSHTGALTGEDDVASAAFRQFGLMRVDDCNQLIDYAMFLRNNRLPKGNRVAAITASGGHAVLVADLGGSMGFDWADYAPETHKALNNIMPAFGQATNPTDLTTEAFASSGMFAEAISIISKDPNIDVTIPVFTINKSVDIKVGADFVRKTSRPAAMLWTGKCLDDRNLTASSLIETNVPVFRDTLACLRAVQGAMNYGIFLRSRIGEKYKLKRPTKINLSKAQKILGASENSTLGENESRFLLEAYGFPSLKTKAAENEKDVVEFSKKIPFPLVMKIDSPDIFHKTEVGGIRLGINTTKQATQAFHSLLASAKVAVPSARINGVLIQEMAPEGTELILGASVDLTFGPIVTIGFGGVYTEILNDVSHRVAPVVEEEAMEMLGELKGFSILNGARGLPKRDLEFVAGLIVRLSWLINDLHMEIAEIDINPLSVYENGKGAAVLDALIIKKTKMENQFG